MKLSIRVGHSFRALRKSKGLTLAQMHQLTGGSLSNLSKIESGGSQSVGFDLLGQMAKALGCDLYEVIAMAEGVELNARGALSTRESELMSWYAQAPSAGKATIELVAASQAAPEKVDSEN